MTLLGFTLPDVVVVVGVALLICTTVCMLAMEAAVLFTPAFLFLFPAITSGFPAVTMNEAVGLALVIEAFGYTSSVLAYWYRRQVLWRTETGSGLRICIIAGALICSRDGTKTENTHPWWGLSRHVAGQWRTEILLL